MYVLCVNLWYFRCEVSEMLTYFSDRRVTWQCTRPFLVDCSSLQAFRIGENSRDMFTVSLRVRHLNMKVRNDSHLLCSKTNIFYSVLGISEYDQIRGLSRKTSMLFSRTTTTEKIEHVCFLVSQNGVVSA